MQRIFANIIVEDINASRRFYVDFLGMEVRFESDWFLNLGVAGSPGAELGLLASDGETIPEAAQKPPAGVILTVAVEDVDELHGAALREGIPVVEGPRNLFYGQRRMLLRDPDGALVDVSSRCDPDPDWAARVKQAGDGRYFERS